MKEKGFILTLTIPLTIFVLVSFLINFSSIKIMALNENSMSTIPFSSDNETINNGNTSMMLPGANMTFGLSLDNAKMHLMEAIMDIKDNNIDGALMQLNMTGNYINEHEVEMTDMMLMFDKIKEANNTK